MTSTLRDVLLLSLVLCGLNFGQETMILINTTWEGSRTPIDKTGHVQKHKSAGKFTLSFEGATKCRIAVDDQMYKCSWQMTPSGFSVERTGTEGSHWVERFDLAIDDRMIFGSSRAADTRSSWNLNAIKHQDTYAHNLKRVGK